MQEQRSILLMGMIYIYRLILVALAKIWEIIELQLIMQSLLIIMVVVH